MASAAENKLRKFLNLPDEAELCPVAQKIIKQYLDLPEQDFKALYDTVPRGVEFMQQQGFLPPQQAQPVIMGMRSIPQSHEGLYHQLLLFAAGSQLAFDMMTPEQKHSLTHAQSLKALYEHNVARNIDRNGIQVLYAHTNEKDPDNPESVLVTLGGAIAFSVCHLQAGQINAVQAQRDGYAEQVRLALHAGAEETLHALQHHDATIKAELEPKLIARYGKDWDTERAKQLVASRTSKESILAFSKEDPFEIDVDAMTDQLDKRIEALKGKFFSPQRGF